MYDQYRLNDQTLSGFDAEELKIELILWTSKENMSLFDLKKRCVVNLI